MSAKTAATTVPKAQGYVEAASANRAKVRVGNAAVTGAEELEA